MKRHFRYNGLHRIIVFYLFIYLHLHMVQYKFKLLYLDDCVNYSEGSQLHFGEVECVGIGIDRKGPIL